MRNVSLARNESLEKMAKELSDQNGKLSKQLEIAYQKLPEIAEKAIEGSSQGRSLTDLQKLLLPGDCCSSLTSEAMHDAARQTASLCASESNGPARTVLVTIGAGAAAGSDETLHQKRALKAAPIRRKGNAITSPTKCTPELITPCGSLLVSVVVSVVCRSTTGPGASCEEAIGY
jgi:hypothetical protein